MGRFLEIPDLPRLNHREFKNLKKNNQKIRKLKQSLKVFQK